jgi:hypothetical protein
MVPPANMADLKKVIPSSGSFFKLTVEVFYWQIDTDRQAFFIVKGIFLFLIFSNLKISGRHFGRHNTSAP